MDTQDMVKHSYSKDDVTVLLKDLSGLMKPLPTEERERRIQSGLHYSEMLPLEYEPSRKYMEVYEKALKDLSRTTAEAVQVLAYRLMEIHDGPFVIISLARAGLPIGILLKRAMKMMFKIDCPHYSISIIRGKGIDINAMEYIYSKESSRIGVEHFQFIDGWVGKGAISDVLASACNELKEKDSKWDSIDATLGVLADPANTTRVCGTHEDFLIPSACLNSTVSGLVSRTVLNDLIKPGDLHGAVYYKELEPVDRSNEFISIVSSFIMNSNLSIYEVAKLSSAISNNPMGKSGMDTVISISSKFNIGDINLIKPGVGETTRVLLRRVPWKVLIDDKSSDTKGLEHIIQLCNEKDIHIERYDLGNYRTCGIIKDLSADA